MDTFGRVATDLRLSLTDRCNLRCTYCMPAEGLPWIPRTELLTAAELVRLARIAVTRLGIAGIRLTGGEPTLRPDLVEIVGQLAALRPRPELSLTTNGLRLPALAEKLRAAGLDRVNVSLDTLDPERFRRISRRDGLADVLAGLEAANAAGLHPVKVNAVLVRGVNADEALSLLRFCLRCGYELRFIEQMPLDPYGAWNRSDMVTAAEIHSVLAEHHRLVPLPGRGSAPAESFLIDDGPACVGLIAAVTAPFCQACDRIRLTADGQIRNCLFARTETDLRTPMRAGESDEDLAVRWVMAVHPKRAGHGIDDPAFVAPERSMSAIGG